MLANLSNREFYYVSKISKAINFIPQLRPPQPAVYLFVLDVSHNGVEAGYLSIVCQALLENLDK